MTARLLDRASATLIKYVYLPSSSLIKVTSYTAHAHKLILVVASWSLIESDAYPIS